MSSNPHIIYDPAHHWKTVEDVPPEAIDYFLSGQIGTFVARELREDAKVLLKTLRYLQANNLWGHLDGVSTWAECLTRFGLTPQQWDWLQAGEPLLVDGDTPAQGIQKGKERATYLEAGQAWLNEEGTQEEIAEKFGITQQAVSQGAEWITSEMSDSDTLLVIPDHLKNRNDRADFLRLSPEGQERVRNKEPFNRVAVSEGIRRRLTPLETVQKSFRKLSKPDRDAFDLWRAEQPL